MHINHDLLLSAAWINGCERESQSSFAVNNPSDGNVIAKVTESDGHLAHLAIDAAVERFSSWQSLPPLERADIIEAWAAKISQNLDDLATILSAENGKILREAKDELKHGVGSLRWCAQSLLRLTGETLPVHAPSQRNYTIKQAVGVVACITPWNFPAAAILVKVGAAIAAGCTVVIKPSEETPLIALALAKLSHDAGIPPGVINVIPCSNPQEVAKVVCEHPEISMLSFTGSIPVGKQLYEACAPTLKRVALELGGNAPFIVFGDADLDKAIDGALSARYYNSGQICVGANRFYIHKSLYQDFSERLASRASTLTSGDGFNENTQLGPIINRKAKDRLQELITDATSKGAKVLTGNSSNHQENLYLEATVLGDMNQSMRAHDEEIFGPIACLYAFEDEDEVLSAANRPLTGLAAYVYSQDVGRLIRMSEKLTAGVVGANSTQIFSNDLPFGGVKQSGLGREHGIACLEEFLQTKSISLAFNDKRSSE